MKRLEHYIVKGFNILPLIAVFFMLLALTQPVKAQDAFMGYDYVSGTYPLPWTTSQTTFNASTAKEIIYTMSGGGLYTATTAGSSGINGYQLNANASFVEMQLTANSTTSSITNIAFTGSTNNNTTAGDAGVVFSNQFPFSETSVIGASAVPFPNATGPWIVLNPTIPEGAKSMRIYRRIFYNSTTSTISTSAGDGFVQYGTGTTIRLASLAVTLAASGSQPTVTTTVITNITQTTASSGGNVTDGGSSAVTERGVVWSTSQNPTIADNKTVDGSGTGSFTSSITGLTAGTTYYVRAYATNSFGTSYGAQESFSTLSGVADIVLSSDNPAVPAGNIITGSLKNPVYKFNLAVTIANTQLNQVNFMTEGTYTSSDVTKLQLWFNSTDNFGDAVQIGTDITTNLGGVSNLSFGSLTQAINAAATGYLWITADVSESATAGRIISIDAVNTAGLTFSSGNKSGTAFGGGLQTIIPAGNPDVHFRTKASGNWNATSTWETSVDSVAWVDATLTPTNLGKSIHVRTLHTVTVTESVTVDQVVVDEGAVVLVEGSPVVFTIADGGGSIDMLVNGLLKSTGTANASPGPHTVNVDGVLHFGSTGVYEHAQNAGAIPVAVWGTGSTMKLTGTTGGAPANRNQNYHHLVFDTPGLSSNLNMGFNNHVISGNVTIVSTGATTRWQLCGPPTGETATLDIMGDIIHLSGNFSTHGTGNGNTTIIINHYGNIIASNGNFSIARGSQGGSGTTSWLMHSGNISLSNLETQNSNAAGARFIFTGTNEQSLTISNITYAGGGLPIIVDSGATASLGSSVIAGNGVFIVNDFGGINTSLANGFAENLLTTGTITLSNLGNYGYNGSVAQLTGTFIPNMVNGLIVNNSAGVTLSTGFTVSGKVEVLSGKLHLNGHNINLGTTGTLVETPGNTVTGATGTISASAILPASVAVNVGGLGAMITSDVNNQGVNVVRFHSAAQGNDNVGIFRQFNISVPVVEDRNTLSTGTLRLYYDESELNSIPEANLRLFKSVDGVNNNWHGVGGIVNTSENYVQLMGTSIVSYWTLADLDNPIPVELVSFNADIDKGKVVLSWITATELNNSGWDIERKSESSTSEWTTIGFVTGKGNSTDLISYNFADTDVSYGVHQYRLKQIDFDGTIEYSNEIEIDLGMLPDNFTLNQNYPNPFNPSTIISFDVPQSSFINLSVYSILGEKVATLVNEFVEQGRYNYNFDASELTSGTYIYRLSADGVSITKKMMLTK